MNFSFGASNRPRAARPNPFFNDEAEPAPKRPRPDDLMNGAPLGPPPHQHQNRIPAFAADPSGMRPPSRSSPADSSSSGAGGAPSSGQPATPSPATPAFSTPGSTPGDTPDEDDDDPLAAFMRENDQKLQASNAAAAQREAQRAADRQETIMEVEILGGNDFGQADSALADYEEHQKQKRLADFRRKAGGKGGAGASPADSEDVDEAALDLLSAKKQIAPLDPVNHEKISYPAFEKNFYREHSGISKLTEEEVLEVRKEMEISCAGQDVPRPVPSFAQLALREEFLQVLRKHEFETPTAIQAQSIPALLQGRDVIGTAQTGSGKTLAYVLPMLAHILGNYDRNNLVLQKGEGPVGLVLAPTQDLAIQIEKEIYRFAKKSDVRTVTLAGGLGKQEQFRLLKKGCEVVVGSPGRITDLLKMKAFDLSKVCYLVLDEADRMLDMGFEAQVGPHLLWTLVWEGAAGGRSAVWRIFVISVVQQGGDLRCSRGEICGV